VSGGDPLITRLTKAAEAVTGDDQRAATFARGLVLGALVGAAIAGSTIWQRRHARPAVPEPVGKGPVAPASGEGPASEPPRGA
jgi:hypothetical protein